MKRPLVCSVLLVWVCLGSLAARAEQSAQSSPRDLWAQAAGAIDGGDVGAASKTTAQLVELARTNGIKTLPMYAASAAALSRQAAQRKNAAVAEWGDKAADQLDPSSATVAFIRSEAAANAGNWKDAVVFASRGIGSSFATYRSRVLSRSDAVVVATVAAILTASLFAIILFLRYARSMAHDFREILGQRIRGGSVTVLAFALLFLPLFLWLGPVWLMLYWFVIFFGYANVTERVLIIIAALVIAAAPLVLDVVANEVAGIDSPVMVAEVASVERSYEPDALRRMQELVAVVPNNPTLHLLLGNLLVQEGNHQQAGQSYRRSIDLQDTAGAHVNLGFMHFLDNDMGAAINEFQRAEQLDPTLAIAFYDHSIAAGEAFHFDEQAKMLDQAKRLDGSVERLASSTSKLAMYHPPISSAWAEAEAIARRGVARSLFGNYAWFDPLISIQNPVTLGGVLTIIAAPLLFLKRRRAGLAGACIKCGRTFCHRCKSARESATYCTQCIHIYLKRDGVSLATKRDKLDQVQQHQHGMARRNKIFSSFLPGTGQMLEGRTLAGVIGLFVFLCFVSLAVLTGHLAPVLAPGGVAKILVRVVAILLAIVVWFLMTPAIYRRKVAA